MADELKVKLKQALIESAENGSGSKRSKSQDHYFLMTIISILVIIIPSYGSSVQCNPLKVKIIPSAKGVQPSSGIAINGFTKNIPPENRYIWISVDVERLGLCRPKQRVYKENTSFKRKILEEGPKGSFMVSLYAVDWD